MLAALKLRQIRDSSRLAEQENEAFREAEALALMVTPTIICDRLAVRAGRK